MMKHISIILLAILSLGVVSCDYLDVDPVGKVIPKKTSEYRALLTSAYTAFPGHKRLLSLRADELFPMAFMPTYSAYIDLALVRDEGADSDAYTYPWLSFYKVIFFANSVIEDVMGASVDSPADTREQMKGEALLLRAYAHFELLNLYAKPYVKETAATDRGIPLSLKVDISQVYVPQSIEKVYGQILADIAEALPLLDIDEQPAAVRYRFSKKAALALQARVRLYRSEWDKALAIAEEILPSCGLEDLNDAGVVAPYRYDSKESIMALELTGGVGLEDDSFVLPNLTDKYDPDGDLRLGMYFRSSWAGYVPDKCHDKSMRVTFRSGEIYLIAAEAAAHITGKLDIAKSYLRQLWGKRLTPSYYAQKSAEVDGMGQEELIAEIADERARELALEGHRWFDLRRTTRPEIIKVYMDTNFEEQQVLIKPNDSRYVIPFPAEATENNPNLRD